MSRPLGGRLCVAVAVLMPLTGIRADDVLVGLGPFFAQHCHECHGPDKQKNDIRFDTLGTDLSDKRTLETWQGALDQLNLGEMPPKKKARPDREEVSKVVDFLVRLSPLEASAAPDIPEIIRGLFAFCGEARVPELFPLGVPHEGLAGLRDSE